VETDLKWYSKMPDFIIDRHLPEMSASAAKLLLYLNRRINRDRSGANFGRWWGTFKRIEQDTGLKRSNLNAHIKVLQGLGLLEPSFSPKGNRVDGFTTAHQFRLTWYKRLADLRNKVRVDAGKGKI
jgi:DNA-binding MarR family transcriptional regulator